VNDYDDIRALREKLGELEKLVESLHVRDESDQTVAADRDVHRRIRIPPGGIGAGNSLEVEYYTTVGLAATKLTVFNKGPSLAGSPTGYADAYAAWIEQEKQWQYVNEWCNA
jgi:hypothetical protein